MSPKRPTETTHDPADHGPEMELLPLFLRFLRRDPSLTRDDTLFVTVFAFCFGVVATLGLITAVWGDAPAFLYWLGIGQGSQ